MHQWLTGLRDPQPGCIIALLAAPDTGKSFIMANVRRRDQLLNSYLSNNILAESRY